MMKSISRVLLVDDNEIDNFISRRVIEKAGFADHIDIRISGREALDFLKANAENEKLLPDIIFLDLNMPVVDGFLFLFEYDDLPGEVKRKCKIVVLSSVLDDKTIERILNDDYVNSFIMKPLTEDSLLNLEFSDVSVR
jgi:CheY-like chemotaxis protein